jgi:acetyltransferase
MNSEKLKILFAPKTIAVIGASDEERSVGWSLMKNLTSTGFSGTIYPVNPKHETIFGLKAYKNVGELPEPADLVIIAVPARYVVSVADECGKAGAKGMVVISAGFKEIGAEGEILMSELKKVADSYDIPILGPNCMGYIRPNISLNASFGRKMAKSGNITFISQSGALGSAVLDWAVRENVGFSHFISIGDMMDIGFHHLIAYLESDAETKSIVIYMESLTNAAEFLVAAKNCTKVKPIIVLKAGRSPEGSHAAMSHTGSIAGNDAVFDAAFRRVGVLRVGTIAELFDCAKTLSMQRKPSGNKLAIVTNAGGPGVIATDALVDMGGQLAKLSDSIIGELSNSLPAHWSHGNPIDVLGDADSTRYKKAVEICLTDNNIDGILTILTPQAMTDAVAVAHDLVNISGEIKKPLLASWMGEDDVNTGTDILEQGNIPSFEEPEAAVRAFMNMYTFEKNLRQMEEESGDETYKTYVDISESKKIIASVRSRGRSVLTEFESKKLLSNYNIIIPPGRVAITENEAMEIAANLKFPLAMKIVSPDILHKTDVGGVVVGVTDINEVKKEFNNIINSVKNNLPQAVIDGIYLEEMVHKRFELLIGCKKDPIFGPAVVFGSGGVAVEVFRDTNVGLPPITRRQARRMIDDTKISKLLSGYRGMPGANMSQLEDVLLAVSSLVTDFPEIKELDINPLTVDAQGYVVLDAKIILEKVE